MKRFAVIALAAVLALSACGREEQEVIPDFTFVPAVVTPEPQREHLEVIEPETEGVKLDENELKALNRMLFGNRYGENWYLRSIPVLWNTDSPADIDLYALFCGGFSGECDNLGYDELLYLSMQTGIEAEELQQLPSCRLPEYKMDLVLREYYGLTLPEYKMDLVLREYYGLTLTETCMNGLGGLLYYSPASSYYILGSLQGSISVGIHSAYEQADGGFIIYYCSDELYPTPDCVMRIVPNEYGSYRIVMNKPVT